MAGSLSQSALPRPSPCGISYPHSMNWQIFWTVLGGALGGAIVGAGATLLVTILNHRHEHKKWLREEKLEAYIEFIRICQTLFHKTNFMNKSVEEAQKMVDNITSTLARIDLVAPSHVSRKCDELRASLTAEVGTEKHKRYENRLRELRSAMREDIQNAKKHIGKRKSKSPR